MRKMTWHGCAVSVLAGLTGQIVIVENKAGAATNIGTEFVARIKSE